MYNLLQFKTRHRKLRYVDMKRSILAIMIFTVCLFCFSACAGSEDGSQIGTDIRETVMGEWVSTDYDLSDYKGEAPNPGIVITFKENGTSSRYFYADLNDDHLAGKSGVPWFCEGNTVYYDYEGELEYALEYDAKTDTLVHTEGYLVQTFTRK